MRIGKVKRVGFGGQVLHGPVWRNELKELMQTEGRVTAAGRKGEKKPVSNATIEKREKTLVAALSTLHHLGYKIQSVHAFRKVHVNALVKHWEEKGLSASTMQNRISVLRTFAQWIGKDGMLGQSTTLVSDPARVTRKVNAQYDHSWSAAGVNAKEMLDTVSAYDPRVGMQLRLCHAFFLRVQEAVMLKPVTADKDDSLLVRDGTKGGRERLVKIETDYQREVLDAAKAMARVSDGYVGHPDLTLEQALAKVTTVCTRFGLTKKGLGVTPHGLRHEGLNDLFEKLAGVPSPVRTAEGAKAALKAVPKEKLAYARKSVSEAAGHARISISGAYIGGLMGPRTRLSPHSVRVAKDWTRFFELRATHGLGILEQAELNLLRKKLLKELDGEDAPQG